MQSTTKISQSKKKIFSFAYIKENLTTEQIVKKSTRTKYVTFFELAPLQFVLSLFYKEDRPFADKCIIR